MASAQYHHYTAYTFQFCGRGRREITHNSYRHLKTQGDQDKVKAISQGPIASKQLSSGKWEWVITENSAVYIIKEENSTN